MAWRRPRCRHSPSRAWPWASSRTASSVLARLWGARGGQAPGQVDADTVFAIRFDLKSFTTATIAMLVDEGRLHWDDPVIDHLADFRLYDPYVTREFTVRDLLTQRTRHRRG
ncbi:MAG: serine hydrolase domain-containing protein [Steroidobacteraceae bacterium]